MAFTSTFCPHFAASLQTRCTGSLSPCKNRRYTRSQTRTGTICSRETGTSAAVPSRIDASSRQLKTWNFHGFSQRYLIETPSDDTASTPILILVHGFGANCEHWRNNIKQLAAGGYRVYAMDLIGFGLGEKPAPGTVDETGFSVEYSFTYWSIQLHEFIDEVIRPSNHASIYTAANSIGSLVTMQADVENDLFSGHVFISPTLRLLDVRKRTTLTGIGAAILQSILGINAVGNFFLNTLAKRENLKSVLEEAYEATEAIDDDLLHIISYPAKTPGALAVFQAFINLDSGPIPEDLIPGLKCPAIIVWGKQDTFEPIALGRALGEYDTIRDFVEIDKAGHCAQDEAPEIVNNTLLQFFDKIEREK